MSSPRFHVVEHIVPGQHVRNYSKSTSGSQDSVFRLAVKQYIPQYTSPPQPGDVTIIACHASGFPKELYEPIWDDLIDLTKASGSFRIRGTWIADVANQGASGVLNAHILGNEPSWYDHSRDYMAIVNHFRGEMPTPIVGFGHSMGGTVLVNTALMHPRFFATLATIEPIINTDAQGMNFGGAYPLTFKQDTWPSMEEASNFFRNKSFQKFWDRRTLDCWLEHALVPSKEQGSVALTTTRYQEALSFAKASYPPRGQDLSQFKPTKREHPDLGDDRNPKNGFYRPEATITFKALPYLQPSCYFIYGEKTHMASAMAQGQKDKLETTGTGTGGSGGAGAGRVKQDVIKGSHFVPFERPAVIAKLLHDWYAVELQRWREEESDSSVWGSTPMEKRSQFQDDWSYWMKKLRTPAKMPGKRAKL